MFTDFSVNDHWNRHIDSNEKASGLDSCEQCLDTSI